MQTSAVQWLVNELKKYDIGNISLMEWKVLNELSEQAKEMEKQQIIDAFDCDGSPEPGEIWISNGVQYYDQTYK